MRFLSANGPLASSCNFLAEEAFRPRRQKRLSTPIGIRPTQETPHYSGQKRRATGCAAAYALHPRRHRWLTAASVVQEQKKQFVSFEGFY